MKAALDPSDASELELLRQLAGNVDDMLWLANRDVTKLLYVNRAHERFWGKSDGDLTRLRQKWVELVFPEDQAAARAGFRQAIETGSGCAEFRLRAADGSVRWIRERIFPVRNQEGQTTRLAGIAQDITEARAIEDQLRASEQRNKLVSDLSTDYVYGGYLDGNGQFVLTELTEGFTRVFGYTLDDVIARGGWTSIVHPDDVQAEMEKSRQNRANQTTRHQSEVRLLTKSGEFRWLRYSAERFAATPGGPLDRILGAVLDITERRQAEERLKELSRSLLEVQEQERRHLARELHDAFGQQLTCINLLLQKLEPAKPDERDALGQAQMMVKELIAQVRDLSLRLRPAVLDDLGLLAAVLWLVESARERLALVIDFEQSGVGGRFDPAVETAAYRIVQEALTNLARHSGQSKAVVRIWLDAGELNLSIEDPGVGFEVSEALNSRRSAGLSGMQERIALLGGILDLESRKGGGTRIHATIPVDRTQEGQQP
jgi:PAS domain S-box-containing protein